MTESEELELLELEETEYQFQKQKSAKPQEKGIVQEIFDTIDSYTGAPLRSAAGAIQDGKNPLTAFADQWGEDRSKAPSEDQIAEKLGFSNKPVVIQSAEERKKFDEMNNPGWAASMKQMGKEWEPNQYVPSKVAGVAVGATLDLTNALPAAGMLLKAGSKAVAPLAKATGKALETGARKMALRSAGPMLRDARVIDHAGRVDELGKFILEDLDLKAFDSVDSIAEKASAKKVSSGAKLDEVYEKAAEKFGNVINKIGFDPLRDKAEVLAAAKRELGDAEGASGAINRLSKYLDEVAARHGDKPMDQARAAFKKDLNEYLPKFKNFVRERKQYREVVGKAGDDLSQPVLGGTVDDFQRTTKKTNDVELQGKPASVARPEPEAPLMQQSFLPDMPTGNSEAARIYGKPGDASFGDLGGDAANRVGKNVKDALEKEAQQKFLSQNSDEMISMLGKQAEMLGLDLVPRTRKPVEQAAVGLRSGQGRLPLAPEMPVRPTKPADIRNPMSPRRANEIKGAMDDVVNYMRSPLSKEPATETAFHAARGVVSKKIDEAIESLGGDELLMQLKATNKEYGKAAEISRIAGDRASRDRANQILSLSDKLAGGAGAAASSAQGGPIALATAAVAATTSKLVRKYGASTLAVAADRSSKFLLRSPEMQALAKSSPQAYKAVVLQFTARALEKTEGLPKAASKEIDKDSGTPAQEPAKKPEAEKPKKGRDKWASDGFDNIAKHDGSLSLSKENLLKDPKAKELLIAASDLKPGSKAMDKILRQIEASQAIGKPEDVTRFFNGSYSDTGRTASSPGERLDSLFGAPTRTAIREMQKGNFKGAASKAFDQFNRDPDSAPSGKDIVKAAGVENETLQAALGLGVEVAADPSNLLTGPAKMLAKALPMAGQVQKVARGSDEAMKILKKIDTPEKAIALKGAEKKEYLKALDEVYGPRDQRAKDMGFGKKTWYHGTQNDFDEFNPAKYGSNTEGPGARLGAYFTDSPKLASDYAGEVAEKVMPVRLNQKNGVSYHPETSTFGYDEAAMAKSAIKEGAPTVGFRDVHDPYLDTSVGPSNLVLVADPSRIRSTNASFDPRFKNSAKLLAGQMGGDLSSKGAEKWAAQGLSKVEKHLGDELNEKELMKDREMKELLIKASDLEPGSKAMDKLVKSLKQKDRR